jgi:1,2-diacylglycerol 3-beta-glucosyltransferase
VHSLANVLLAVLSAPVLAWTTYLAILAVFSRRPPGSRSSSSNPSRRSDALPWTKFDVIVPAHDEEIGIAATVHSLLGVDYPAELRRLIVVADNCADATAARAREAGAIVLERQDKELRGKGYALAYAFDRSVAEGFADCVVVVDADSKVTPNLLRAFAARRARGAEAMQANYAVSNPEASWRTRLLHIAFTLFHDVRSLGRERLGLSAGLRGNGMAFSTGLLAQVPHDAFSVVEDVEYGIRLGVAGHRVHYAGEAHVFGEMVATERAARSQRRRWEGGRGTLARRHALRLIAEGLRRRSLVLLDLAADLLVPPLTYVVAATAVGVGISTVWVALGHGAWWSLAPWLASLAGFVVYLVRGVWLSGAGPRAILDLMWAPVYMLWKIALAVRALGSREREWVRTAREGEKR